MKQVVFLFLMFTTFSAIGQVSIPQWEWATGWSTNLNGLNDIAVDTLGNSYVIGGFFSVQIIESDLIYSISDNVVCSPQCPQSFIAKLDSEGNFLWSSPILANGFTNVREVKIANNGNIYVLTEFKESSSSSTNFKIMEYSPAGELLNYYISPLISGGLTISTFSIDSNNNIVIPTSLNGGPVVINGLDYTDPFIVFCLTENLTEKEN